MAESSISTAEFHTKRALALILKEQFKEALTEANAALALAPDDIQGLNLRALALLRLGKNQKAYTTIQDAIRLNPNNVDSHVIRARIYTKSLSFQNAKNSFLHAISITPNNIHCLTEYGLFLFHRKEFAAFEEILNRCISLKKDNQSVLYLRSIWALQNNKQQEAFDFARWVLSLNSRHAGAIRVIKIIERRKNSPIESLLKIDTSSLNRSRRIIFFSTVAFTLLASFIHNKFISNSIIFIFSAAICGFYCLRPLYLNYLVKKELTDINLDKNF